MINRDVVSGEGSRRTGWVDLVAMATVSVREAALCLCGCTSKQKLLLCGENFKNLNSA